MRLWDLFLIFFRAGMVFGGGTTVMTIVLKELVDNRKLIPRAEFLATYGLARLVPSGTMTSLAVALGHMLGGLPGSVVALAGVALPSLIPSMVLVVLYDTVRGSPYLDLLPVTLLPAAVALLAGAVLSVGKEVARPSLDLVIAIVAGAVALLLRANPGVVLLAAGVIGAVAFRDKEATK